MVAVWQGSRVLTLQAVFTAYVRRLIEREEPDGQVKVHRATGVAQGDLSNAKRGVKGKGVSINMLNRIAKGYHLRTSELLGELHLLAGQLELIIALDQGALSPELASLRHLLSAAEAPEDDEEAPAPDEPG